MSGNGAVWGRVRSRLRAFPERLAACGAEAAAYGRCVQASTAPGGRLTKDLCAREFEALRSCFAAAVGGRRPVLSLPNPAARVPQAFPCGAPGAAAELVCPRLSGRGTAAPARGAGAGRGESAWSSWVRWPWCPEEPRAPPHPRSSLRGR